MLVLKMLLTVLDVVVFMHYVTIFRVALNSAH